MTRLDLSERPQSASTLKSCQFLGPLAQSHRHLDGTSAFKHMAVLQIEATSINCYVSNFCVQCEGRQMAYQGSLRPSLRCGTWAALHSSTFGSPGVRLHARKLARSAIGKNGAAWLLVKVWFSLPAPTNGQLTSIARQSAIEHRRKRCRVCYCRREPASSRDWSGRVN